MNYLSLLVEILFLAFLGLLYYLHQKRRLNKKSKLARKFWEEILALCTELNQNGVQSVDLEQFMIDLKSILATPDNAPSDEWIHEWKDRDLPEQIRELIYAG